MKAYEKYERFDSCYGTIIEKYANGIKLILDNDEEAFAYQFTSHKRGETVLCSVKAPAKNGKNIQVYIDSIGDDREMAS